MTRKYHVYNSTKGRYGIILGRYLLRELGSIIKLSEHVIKVDDGPFKWSTTPMIDLSA